MIVVFHKYNKAVKIINLLKNKVIDDKKRTIQQTLISLSKKFPNELLGWCHSELENFINIEAFPSIFKHPLIFASFETSGDFYIDKTIGYVEDSPFIKVKKEVTYPTWLTSSDIGAVHASVLQQYEKLSEFKMSFDYFLASVAKSGIKKGLFCYSEPKLITIIPSKIILKKQIHIVELLQFIKSNYRFRWVFLYVLNVCVYKKHFLLVPLLKSIFKKSKVIQIDFDTIPIKNTNTEKLTNPTIDVIIPTLGREIYLKDVLVDLSKQTLLPQKVIIVEQNPDRKATSALYFLDKKWPFEIKHTFTNNLGACNARNIALQAVTSDWVFFADDDIRLKKNTIEEVFKIINRYTIEALSISCLQSNEVEKNNSIFQSATFGSGTSFVNSKKLSNIKFGMEYELGYGEDVDFGMQLRNNGVDIVYTPFVKMLHLKAPSGGFRTKIKADWDSENVKPKPSPTIMVFNLKHKTKEQIKGYKTLLFLKFYKLQSIKNPLKYIRRMKTAWKVSEKYAKELINRYSNEL